VVKNVTVEVMDIETAELGDMDSKLTIADGSLGSPTINQNTLCLFINFVMVSPLRDRGKLQAHSAHTDGAVRRLAYSRMFKNLKLRFFEEPAALKFMPESDKEKMLIEYGERFAQELATVRADV
jgi:flavorubredoxin